MGVFYFSIKNYSLIFEIPRLTKLKVELLNSISICLTVLYTNYGFETIKYALSEIYKENHGCPLHGRLNLNLALENFVLLTVEV
uniref:Uncharacterized protein n=1 Tax=Metallosphaera hakonensis JCM 8857 = DSM 7519 TaxID=1293036 RepID=A0A2U9IRT0_9CREN